MKLKILYNYFILYKEFFIICLLSIFLGANIELMTKFNNDLKKMYIKWIMNIFCLFIIVIPFFFLSLLQDEFYNYWEEYLMVILLTSIVSFLELRKTFKNDLLKILCIKWSWAIFAFNCLITVILFSVLLKNDKCKENIFVTVFSVGLGFQILIRTNFTLAKANMGHSSSESDVKIDIGKIYDELHGIFREQIDLSMLGRRNYLIKGLAELNQDIDDLYKVAIELINTRQNFSSDDISNHKKYLNDIKCKPESDEMPQDEKKYLISLFILTHSSENYVENMIKVLKKTINSGDAT